MSKVWKPVDVNFGYQTAMFLGKTKVASVGYNSCCSKGDNTRKFVGRLLLPSRFKPVVYGSTENEMVELLEKMVESWLEESGLQIKDVS